MTILPKRKSQAHTAFFNTTLSEVWQCLLVLCGTVVKNLSANAGDPRDAGSISGLWRCLGEGNGNPLQYSCLENPKDRGDWPAIVHGVTESQTQLKWLSSSSWVTCLPWTPHSRLNVGSDFHTGRAGHHTNANRKSTGADVHVRYLLCLFACSIHSLDFIQYVQHKRKYLRTWTWQQ